MWENTINELFDLLSQEETEGPEKDPALAQVARKKWDCLEKLEAQCGPVQKELLEGFYDADGEIEYHRRRRRFADGFRLGARMMLDALTP